MSKRAVYLSSSFYSCHAPWIELRVPSFPFAFIFTCSWSIHLMVEWCSRLYEWFPSVCEMFQTSWGGGPSGSPPHVNIPTHYAIASHAVSESWWVKFLPITLSIACTYPRDDPFSFVQPLLVHHDFSHCSTLPPNHSIEGRVIISHVVRYYCIQSSLMCLLLTFTFLGEPLFLF